MIKFILKILFTGLLFLLFHLQLKAQDTIMMKNGERYIAKILTIEQYKITYKLFADQNGPTFIVRRIYIDQIILPSGILIDSKNKSSSSNHTVTINKIDNKKNALKWEALALSTNDLCFGYERHLAKNFSGEIKIALIGVGNYNVEGYSLASGYFVKLGCKFINPRSGNPNSNYGVYLKPEVCYTQFTIDNSNYKVDYRSTYGMINLGIMIGTFGNFAVELYGGIGIAYNQFPQSSKVNNYLYGVDNSRSYFYSNVAVGNIRANTASTVYAGGLVLAYHF